MRDVHCVCINFVNLKMKTLPVYCRQWPEVSDFVARFCTVLPAVRGIQHLVKQANFIMKLGMISYIIS